MENKAQSIVSKHNNFKVMLDLNLGMQEAEKTCINSKKYYSNSCKSTFWMYVFDDQSLLSITLSDDLYFGFKLFDNKDQSFIWKNV